MAETKKTTKKTSAETKKVGTKAAAPKKAAEAKKEVAPKKEAAPKKVIAEKKAAKPAAAPTAKKPGVSYIKIQQFASGAGRLKNQVQTLKGLGLNKVNKISELEDTQSVRGMINTVKHLVKIIG